MANGGGVATVLEREGGWVRGTGMHCVSWQRRNDEKNPREGFGASRNCEVTLRLETTSPRRNLLAILCQVTTWGFLDVCQKISRGSIENHHEGNISLFNPESRGTEIPWLFKETNLFYIDELL